MKRLWAPWRVRYIEGEKPSGCILCIKSQPEKDKENYVVYRGKTAFVMMNLYPYNSGHLMISPFRHVADLEGLNEEELKELMLLLRKSISVLKKSYKPQGFNIGINLGEVSGAGVSDHVHIHLVPRWGQDTNFMPVITNTKVISQALNETYERLTREKWSQEGKIKNKKLKIKTHIKNEK